MMRRIAFGALVRSFGATLTCSCSTTGNIATVIQIVLWKSLLGHLAASLGWGSVEGEQVHKAEWPQEHLLLLRDLIELGAPCRPALAICQHNFCHISLMQLCC